MPQNNYEHDCIWLILLFIHLISGGYNIFPVLNTWLLNTHQFSNTSVIELFRILKYIPLFRSST